ncbi:MAG: DUF433 domain-containing protein [Candidatus Kapabacteria bacterium]|nr:DUF433 domain-containing protein [Ignavibacteriota bacterium]MCW5885696.1 DUF433 domain-containing protein [Candidatus Kapabacteria bacterium]
MTNNPVNIDNEILAGTAVFTGTRVPVKNLFDYLESGETIDSFIDDFDSVTKEQVLKVLEISEKLIENTYSILNENFA